MFEDAMQLNLQNIDALLKTAQGGRLLDVGCDDGERTVAFARAAGAEEVAGIEAVAERAGLARERGVAAKVADVAAGFPFEDESFDVVVSNQVIEHLHDTDLFVRECRRVLVPGGLLVFSTENLASWHNVFAVTLGWQPFSLTNVSGCTGGLGNPAAVFRGQPHVRPESWQHVRVFAYRGLVELARVHGFEVTDTVGAGYFPLPARLGRVDPRHAVFVTVAARRPNV
jgi:SAM-dependent methyltransferase